MMTWCLDHLDVPPHYLNYFLYMHLHKRHSDRFIPMLEKWLPGVGLQFARKGYSVYQHCHDMTPSELVEALNLFTRHPHFKVSNFVVGADAYLEDANYLQSTERKASLQLEKQKYRR